MRSEVYGLQLMSNCTETTNCGGNRTASNLIKKFTPGNTSGFLTDFYFLINSKLRPKNRLVNILKCYQGKHVRKKRVYDKPFFFRFVFLFCCSLLHSAESGYLIFSLLIHM